MAGTPTDMSCNPKVRNNDRARHHGTVTRAQSPCRHGLIGNACAGTCGAMAGLWPSRSIDRRGSLISLTNGFTIGALQHGPDGSSSTSIRGDEFLSAAPPGRVLASTVLAVQKLAAACTVPYLSYIH